MTESAIHLHATCVALPDGDGGWSGVLLRGAPGAGKSDLALRLIDGGARLVADDQTVLRRAGAVLVASPPAALAGKMEVRGLGILEVPHLPSVAVVLVCDLVDAETVERHPEPRQVSIAETALPLLAVAPFEASAVAKLRLGVETARHGIVGGNH